MKHLPNILSALRLLAAPLAAWLLLHDHDTAALSLFALAGLSDLLDGYIARHWRFTSAFGAWLDPAADKLLILLSLVTLLYLGWVPLWLVVMVLARDITVAVGAVVAWAFSLPMTVAPLLIGKAAAAVLVGYVGAWLLLLAFDQDWPQLMHAAALTVAVFTILSAAAYARVFLKALFFGGRTA